MYDRKDRDRAGQEEASSQQETARAQEEEERLAQEQQNLQRIRAARLRKHRQANAEGRPLPDSLRGPLEQSLGTSFAGVRVHPESPRADGTVRALAEGDDIHLAPGLELETEEGRHLIAHELAHVVQQRGAGGTGVQGAEVSRTTVELEADAEQAAGAALRGEVARVRLAAPWGMAQRFDSFEHLAVIDGGVRMATGKEGQIRLKASGLVVTGGEVGALMKDYFSEFAYLDNCPRERLKPLLDLLRWQLERARDQRGRLTPEQAAFSEKQSQELTAYREMQAYEPGTNTIRPRGALEGGETKSYFTLARENNDHFFGLNLRWGSSRSGVR